MEKAVFCWSGGKDSAMALHRVRQARDYEVAALLTTLTRDYERVSMHGVRRSLLEEQAKSLGLPLVPVYISKSADNAEYETAMRQALLDFKQRGVTTCIFGDIFLADLRRYREEKLAGIGMQAAFPLWGEDTAKLARSFIEQGFGAVTTCVDARLLGEGFVGRAFDQAFLDDLPAGIDPCGENGEFHSFAYAGPVFSRPIAFSLGERLRREDFFLCDLLPDGKEKTIPPAQ